MFKNNIFPLGLNRTFSLTHSFGNSKDSRERTGFRTLTFKVKVSVQSHATQGNEQVMNEEKSYRTIGQIYLFVLGQTCP